MILSLNCQFQTFHYRSLFSLIFSNHYYFLSFNEESKPQTASLYSIINRAHLYCGIGSTLSSCVASLTISHLWDTATTNAKIRPYKGVNFFALPLHIFGNAGALVVVTV